jgi:hypothetical protein
MTTTDDIHKDEELSDEDRAACESGVALSVTIKRMADVEEGIAMTVEIRSHIHTGREARAVLAALDSAKDELESSLIRNSMPDRLGDLLERLFASFLEDHAKDAAKDSDEKGKPADE